jgi:hypothetical protein
MNIQNSTPLILSRVIGTKFFFILSLSLGICLASCDESSVVGLDVQPPNDLLNVNFKDTTTILTRTVREDSLRTDGMLITTGLGLIGKYIDPVFGEATASMYTQVRLPSNITATSFGPAPICDSIILSLPYEGVTYGKTDYKTQSLNVYELSEALVSSQLYYSNKSLNKNSIDLTAADGYLFTPHPLDSVTVNGVRSQPQLRVPLDNSFGQSLLDNQTTGNLLNDATFRNFFKGFYITTENTVSLAPQEGNILDFKMGEGLMTIYYHYVGKASNTVTDSTIHQKYDFSLGSVVRFDHFSHNYSTALADVNAQLTNPAQKQNSTVYVQSMAGLKTKIEFPYLMHWLDSGIVGINKAELIVKIDTTSGNYMLDTYAPPVSMLLFGINDDGTNAAIPDFNEGAAYFGGTYNATTKEYHFNIDRYIQRVLSGKISNNGLYLIASSGAINVNRVVVSGGSVSATRQMKLNIIYTKLH